MSGTVITIQSAIYAVLAFAFFVAYWSSMGKVRRIKDKYALICASAFLLSSALLVAAFMS